MNTISGKDAVEIAGKSPLFFLLNFDIALYFKFLTFLALPLKV